MTNTQADLIDIVDHFLEITNVYHHRFLQEERRTGESGEVTERIQRLVRLIEQVHPQQRAALRTVMDIMDEGATQGQSVVPTAEVLAQTQHYQDLVLSRLGTQGFIMPRNQKTLSSILKLPPRTFLASFKTVSYAWDILTELASITVLPTSEMITVRDLIYMHTVELREHLRRVTAAVKLNDPASIVSLRGEFAVDDLRELDAAGTLINTLIESSLPDSPDLLLQMMVPMTASPIQVSDWIRSRGDEVLRILAQVSRSHPTLVSSELTLSDAQMVCDDLVSFGLTCSYAAWHGLALQSDVQRGFIRKNILFCTRILLDERRWRVCAVMGDVALEIVRDLNRADGRQDIDEGTHMIRANNFFAKKMGGDFREEDIRAWHTQQIHPRYQFLQQILLDDFAAAAEIGKTLLTHVESSGRTNLSVEEFEEWPILEAFRASGEGSGLIREFKSR